jgi:replication factor C small subunit
MAEVKYVRLKKATYDRLKSYGKMGDTMDSLLSRLLDEYEMLKAKNTTNNTPAEPQAEPTSQDSLQEALLGEKEEKENYELWIEKYRPKTVDEMLGEPSLLNQLKAYVKTKNVPNLLLYGKVGCGKTSAALCLVNEILNGHDYLQKNAADLRKDDVREQIVKLARVGSLVKNPYKICIIDECEKMGHDVEPMLRTLMEQYSNNIRFILICNDVEHKAITNPIKSRCTSLEFKPLSKEDIYERLSYIASKENVKISNEKLLEISEDANGDLRTAIKNLQNIAMVQ